MATNTNYDTSVSTVTTLPDPATQALRDKTLASLGVLAARTPTLYGSTWNPNKQGPQKYDFDGKPILDQDGKPVYEMGGWDTNADEPLTAGSNYDLDTSAQRIRALQDGQKQTFTNAQSALGNAGGMDIYGAGAPAYGQAADYYGQASAGQSGLAGQAQFNEATGMYEKAANTNTADVFNPYAAQAQGAYGQAAGQYGQAANLYGQSTGALGLSSASPYLQAAGQSSAQQIGEYMNPYNRAVTDQIAEMGARNLSENILPQISSDFIKAGGYGSTRQRDLVGRAARDTQASILNQQTQALQSGYGQALGASQSDLARQAQLAGTAGGLGTQQQQILQGAAGGYGNVGAGIGNLGTSQAALGSTAANLTGADANRGLQAAQGIQSIGQANIQARQADLARTLAAGQGMAGVGAGLGNLTQANQAGQLAVGAGNISLANAAQNSTMQQIGAQRGLGESEQAFQERLIAAKQGNVTNRTAALYDPLNRALSAASAAPPGPTSATTTSSVPQGSLSSQLLGAGAPLAGGVLASKAKGGAIKKGSLKKSSYGKLPSRGLGMFARAS